MRFEEVIESIGAFGPYQRRVFFLSCLVGIPSSLQTLVTVFLMHTPKHRCALPGLANDTWESQGPWHDDLVNLTLTNPNTGLVSRCEIQGHMVSNGNSLMRNGSVECDRWVYSTEMMESSFITTLNLVCGRKHLVALSNSVFLAGQLAGSFVFGTLSDLIGRKKTLLVGVVGECVVTLATAFVTDYALFATLRFFTTFFGMGMYLSAFVVGVEMVGRKQRTVSSIVILFLWSAGLFLLLMLAYLIRDWRHLQLAVALFNLPYLSLYFLIPESPRWLVSKGRLEEASAIIRTAARANKAVVSERVLSLQDLHEVHEVHEAREVEGQESIKEFITTPSLLARTLIVFFNWCIVSMVYYGLGLNVDSLSGNLHLNFPYSSIAETLSYVACLLALYRVGRRPIHCFAMFLGGGACMAIIFPVLLGSESDQWIANGLAMLGKFGASAAFAICYIFSSELFPTKVRNSVIGVSSVCGRIGSVLSPYVAQLGTFISGDVGKALPSGMFGGLALLAGGLALCLPETANRDLPETIEDAKNMGRRTTAPKTLFIAAKSDKIGEWGSDKMSGWESDKTGGLTSDALTDPCEVELIQSGSVQSGREPRTRCANKNLLM